MTVQATNSLIPQPRSMNFTPKPIGVVNPAVTQNTPTEQSNQNPGAININSIKNSVKPVIEQAGNTFRNAVITLVVGAGATFAVVKSKGLPAVKNTLEKLFSFYVHEIKTVTNPEELKDYYSHLAQVSMKKAELKFKRIHLEFNLSDEAIKDLTKAEQEKMDNLSEIKNTLNYVMEIKQRFSPKEGIMPTVSINLRESSKDYVSKITKHLEKTGRAEGLSDDILKHICSIGFDLQSVKGLKSFFKGSNAVQINVSTTDHIKKRDYIDTTAKFIKEFILPW